MPSFRSLDVLGAALLSLLGSELTYRQVSTRVLLRTGVNLREPRPDQLKDPVAVEKAATALADMGYKL